MKRVSGRASRLARRPCGGHLPGAAVHALVLGILLGSALPVAASPGSGSERVTLHDDSEAPFADAIVRLVALPPGAAAPSVTVLEGVGVEAEVGEPMVLRGLRLAPVRISPAAAPRPLDAPRSIELEIRYQGESAGGRTRPAVPPSRGFFAPYEDLIVGGIPEALEGPDEGDYLIVTVPEFVATLEPLVAWKREMGFEVAVVTTAEAGTTNESIRAYVESIYQSASVPPQYVLLVGDVEQIPGFDYHQSVSDLPYGLLDGDDFFPDVEVGRLSVQNEHQLNTIIAKILRYEQDPYRDEGDAWFSRALVVGGNMGSSTPVPVSRWCRDQLLDPAVGYTEVDSVYFPPYDAVGTFVIRPIIDEGVSIVSYRGWALGHEGWDAPQFTTGDIPSLTNGWKLPVVFSFVCLNGNFAEPACYGEAWIRAGTPTDAQGAVAFLGNSEHWSHTRYNDTAAIGVFNAIRQRGARRMGQLLNASKSEILAQFPDMIHYDPYTDESVEFYYYIYSLLGDPALEIWTGPPETITVSHPASIPQGSSVLEVVVLEEDGVTPVGDVRVGISQGESVLGCVRTDASGLARVLADFEDASAPVKITVTGGGVAPYRSSVPVVSGDPFLALADVTVDDDGSGGSTGNGDGIANPGETVEIGVVLRNRGASEATGVSGTIAALGGATVDVDGVAFPAIPAGGTAAAIQPFVVTIDGDAEDGLLVSFRLELTADGQTHSAGFDLPVQAPGLRYHASTVAGDGVLDPGETDGLTVTLLNEGSVRATASQAILRTATPDLVTVADSATTFDPIAVGLTGAQVTPFTVVVNDSAAMGQAAVFTLSVTTEEGYVSQTGFSLVLGTVDHRAPLGPDAYGYYAYDNSDTDYPDAAPVYEWIPCSPRYGGGGTALGLANNETVAVGLPFPFTFYGQSYDSLLVSDNGWASFEIAPYYDFYNWSMPNAYGTGAQLAPFWDNLDPTKEYEGQPVGDGIYTFYDVPNQSFVVEWSRIGNLRSHHQDDNRPDYDDLQTFQLILFDPAHHPTPTGDGIVRFQYKQVVNNDFERMYSTVGIENATEDDGLQYTYTNLYAPAAAPLSAGLAIDFTTRAPRYLPFHLSRFTASRTDTGVQLEWEPCDSRPRSGYRVYRAAADGSVQLVKGGRLGPEAVGFLDREADADAVYSYEIGSIDPVGVETRLGPFAYDGRVGVAIALALENAGSNPSPSPVSLRYSLPERSDVQLRIYSVTGQLVRTLVREAVDSGAWDIHWDGRDGRGREVASGVYFARLDAGTESRRIKVTLLR